MRQGWVEPQPSALHTTANGGQVGQPLGHKGKSPSYSIPGIKYATPNGKLVSWSLMSPFSTNMAISGSRVESYPYPVKEGQRYINLNPGRLFVQHPPQGKEIERLI